MDLLLSFAGIGLGAAILYWGISSGAGMSTFLDPKSFLIVLGGTFASIMIGTPWSHVTRALKEAGSIYISKKRLTPAETVLLMINISRKAHKYGLAMIKNEGKKAGNKFLDRAIKMALSGMNSDYLRRVLEKEIIESRHAQMESSNIFRTMGMFSPMFGLVGTVVGIIKLLSQLTSVEAIGPSMALAITTTFYGIFFSNLVFIPTSSKLRLRCHEDTLIKEMLMEGVIAIKDGELPYVIKSQLQSFVHKNIEAHLTRGEA